MLNVSWKLSSPLRTMVPLSLHHNIMLNEGMPLHAVLEWMWQGSHVIFKVLSTLKNNSYVKTQAHRGISSISSQMYLSLFMDDPWIFAMSSLRQISVKEKNCITFTSLGTVPRLCHSNCFMNVPEKWQGASGSIHMVVWNNTPDIKRKQSPSQIAMCTILAVLHILCSCAFRVLYLSKKKSL